MKVMNLKEYKVKMPKREENVCSKIHFFRGKPILTLYSRKKNGEEGSRIVSFGVKKAAAILQAVDNINRFVQMEQEGGIEEVVFPWESLEL